MSRGVIRNAFNLMQKARLYGRVGLKRMTLKKAYVMSRYWILTNIFKRQIPWLIELSVTYRCQCKCMHCSVGKYLEEARHKDELSTDEIKDILDQAVEMGIPKVDYFGGEPLLRDNIVELVRYGESKGLYISVTTNAWLLTRELTKELSQVGISCINISIDSVSEKLHERFRRMPGIYKRAVNAFQYCYKEGIPSIFSTYVTHSNIENFGSGESDNSGLSNLISFAREVKASGIRILFPIISGKWAEDKSKEFSEEEKSMVIDNIDISFAFIEGAYSVLKKRKICQSLSGKMFNISPYGDIQLCIVFPESFGNIRESSLKDLLRDMYSHPVYLKNKDGSCCSTTALLR